jgi:hypothetical protein
MRRHGTGGFNQLGYLIRNRFNGGGNKRQHVLIVEGVLGKPLPAKAVVHHVNRQPADNLNQNLVVLQDHLEHLELHRKMRVRAAGGDPWRDRLCVRCGPKPVTEFHRGHRRQPGRGWAWSSECKTCHTVLARERNRRRTGRAGTADERSEQGRRAALARWRR